MNSLFFTRKHVTAITCLFFCFLQTIVLVDGKKNGNDDYSHADALINWVNSADGGFVSNKLEIRRGDPDDTTSPFGVYAASDIAVDEVVMKIPTSVHLALSKEQVQASRGMYLTTEKVLSEEDYIEIYYGYEICSLTKKLLQEIAIYRESPEKSSYAPFIRYLLETQSRGQLPATYSAKGKELLREISGPLQGDTSKSPSYLNYQLPPLQLVDWIGDEMVARGCFDETDDDAYHAASLVIQRGYDSALIPVWDMVNHDNEQLNLSTNSFKKDGDMRVWATKPIAAGEQLYATYNFCTDCSNVGDDWGTPGMYRDFGFVEGYPQYWPFLDHNVYFYVNATSSNDADEYLAWFIPDATTGEPAWMPDESGLEFFKSNLVRLQGLSGMIARTTGSLPPLEEYMIQEYYRSIKVALKCAIETASAATVNSNTDKAEL